jgi:uncharacterized UBP type Zn finger protein
MGFPREWAAAALAATGTVDSATTFIFEHLDSMDEIVGMSWIMFKICGY